jgi:hypothetical protein
MGWVDDTPMGAEAERPSDDDLFDPEEPHAIGRGQFLDAPMTVSIQASRTTAPAGECLPVLLKARSDTTPLPHVNLDVHASGPSDELDFCDPTDGSERRAPSLPATGSAAHEGEDERESHHPNANGADQQHTEVTTDDAGNAVIGLISPVEGDTTVVSWVDGETGRDNDVQAAAESSSSAFLTWGSGQPRISFLNPSPFGTTSQGTGNGTQLPDSPATVKILTRVDSAEPVPAVELQFSKDGKKTFIDLGKLKQIGTSDLWTMPWDVPLADGNYALKATIPGITSAVIDVKVGAGEAAPMVPNPAYETVRLTAPLDGQPATFKGADLQVAGVASAGAEGVDIFYTRVPSRVTPAGPDWVLCGFVQLDGLGSDDQEFATQCSLRGSDQAAQVTGVAAIAFDCSVPGCDAQPDPPDPDPNVPVNRSDGQKETGDAVRVFAGELHPLLDVEPPQQEGLVGRCVRFEIDLKDQTGQAMFDENVDLHVSGPSGSSPFCDPGDASAWRAPDSGGHAPETPETPPGTHADPLQPTTFHLEAETPPDGKLVFGLTSDEAGAMSIDAWLDAHDDDVRGDDEIADAGTLEWIYPRSCTIVGSTGIDTLIGTDGPDWICGFGGDDFIKGLGGDDVLVGGGGDDDVRAGSGDDLLRGGGGADRLGGGTGTDTCRGGTGKDRVSGCEPPPEPS